MEFLKELLGEELFKQLESKINEHNGNEANKDKQIKLGNLGSGEYVSKAKHDALQAQLAETKIKSALKVALLSEKCSDIDYVTFCIEKKLKEQGKTLELYENENIKGWDDLISGMKTQLPKQFEAAGKTKVEPNPLPKPDDNKPGLTKEEFNKMGYASRVKLKAEQPEVYETMMKG